MSRQEHLSAPKMLFSKEELENDFTNTYKERYKFDYTVTNTDFPKSVDNILKKYDDDYFKENVLFVLQRCTLTPSKPEIIKIKSDGKTFEFHTAMNCRVIDNMETEGYYYYTVFVELPKSALNKDTAINFIDEFGRQFYGIF